jgi:hypothetical protein
MMHDRLDVLRSVAAEAALSHETARKLFLERRAATAAIVARLPCCAPTIEAHASHFADEDSARAAEWEAEQAVIVAENAEEFAARRLHDAEGVAERKRRDAEAIARHADIAKRCPEALEIVLRDYAPAARGIAVLIRTEEIIFDKFKHSAWGFHPALTHPRFLGLLNLPNMTEPDYNRGVPYWYPQNRLDALRWVEPRTDVLEPLECIPREGGGHVAVARRMLRQNIDNDLIAAAMRMLREEYARFCGEIVAAMGVWERVKADVLKWTAEDAEHRHLNLARLAVPEAPRGPQRTDTTMIKSMAGRVFLPALGGGDAFWDWSWPVPRLWER